MLPPQLVELLQLLRELGAELERGKVALLRVDGKLGLESGRTLEARARPDWPPCPSALRRARPT